MRHSRFLVFLSVAIRWSILTVVVGTFVLNSFAQSLADAARKERDRQKTAHSRVIIQGSGSTSTMVQTPSTATTTPAKAAAAKPLVVTDNKGRDEKYWRTAFQNARDDIKRAEARAAILDLRVKELNTMYLRQSDIYNRENQLGPQIAATQKELEDARREVEQANRKFNDLEDELRKSGGPAGWAR